MCGRYALFTEVEIEDIRDMVRDVESRIRYGEIYPTHTAPVLIAETSAPKTRQVAAMRWGFPQFNGSGVIINARSETAATKPLFSNSLLNRRCVAIATGYYEWQKVGKKKTKHLISLPSPQVIYLAGCYKNHLNPDGTSSDRFVLLTTEANTSVATIHNRMPVVLQSAELDTWFSADFASLYDRSSVVLSCIPDKEPSEIQQSLFI